MTTRRRTRTTLATLLGAAAVTAGCAASSAAPPPADAEQRNTHLVREAFTRGVGNAETFYAILADDVTWTVARATAPTTYTSRQQFLDDGAAPIVDRLTGQINAEVHELVADDDQVVARWRGTATARDGVPYVNEYAWVMTMADERVTRVVAYLDLVALDDLITRVPLPR
ncbi:nuclear transport factor 2 family protein [Mycobacterium sp. NPDC050041]|uniref:nuclear transport factor 2 family protein n=1 Tax=Mycobacterium sp. NPDC050041 TaxID=3364293 RepID=UPI003C2D36DB